jgi:hypothetical protein
LIVSVAAWLLQDLLQVLTMGFMLVPEFFMLVVVYMTISGPLDEGRISFWLWFAFAGGVLWDLRWAAVPGMSGLINVAAVATVFWVWNRTPAGGRSAVLFAGLAGGIHFLSGIAHYFSWAVPSQAATRMFLIQQLMSVPALVLLCFVYAVRVRDQHV